MKKALINILKSSLLGILLFGVISCDNIFSNKVSDTENTETLLKISVDDTSLARTLYPSSDASLLSNFTLTCMREDFTTKTKTAADLDALKALVINFADGEEGSWQIQLQASYEISSGTNVQAIAFSDTQSVDVQKNKLNEVSFKLTTENLTVGGLNIKVSFSGSADRVVASLKDETKETSIDEKIFTTSDFTTIEDEKSITFTRSISDTSEALTSGTYYLLFSFYDTTLSSETPLNTLPNYVRIVKGLTTSAELSISLNEVYTITYEDNGGTLASGAIKTGKYSRKSIVNLPQMEKEGYIFAGWYESSDFSGTPVTTIEKGSSGNKTFFARFVSSTLFVSQTGNNENDGMTASTALASVNKAVEKIISYGNIAAAYTIKISGTITGGVNIASTLTTEMASSLTLEGVTGQSGNDWVDVLNGGFTDSNRGTTLAINTAVPVTLKNLKITGGYQGQGNGGGVRLGGDSSLVMESGEISGNTANDGGQVSAGGVYISHGGTSNFGATQIAGAKFTMTGGSICNNTGTGVTLYDGSNPGEFNMYGGTITGNSGYGVNIVYSTGPFGKFTMKGDAVVAANNKVELALPGSTKIYIAGELTESAPVATVTLNGYNENTEIVALAEGVTDTSLLSAACAKIEVAPYNGTPWYLTSDGKLTATDPNGGGGGDPSTWTGSADDHDYVDLGLPSGTLWATMNVGATSVTAPGSDYFWSVDPVKENILAKYTEAGETLLSADDHATVEWGSNWITPTTEQIQELCDKCYFEPVTSYNGVTINGYVVYLAKSQSHVNINELAPSINDAFTYPENYKKTGYSESDPHIFLPARNGGNDVWMWSSTYEGTGYSDNRPLANLFGLADGWGEIIETGIVSNDYTYEYPIRPVYVGSNSGSGGNGGGNSGNTNSIPDDFVLVTGSTIDFNIGYGVFRSCGDYPTTIGDLYVCEHEVTQKEYEKYCIYGTEKDDEGNLGTQYAPTSAHGTGDDYPVYFVSWHDAIVYCNLRSLDEHLTPVYSLPKPKTNPNDPDEALVYSTKPSEWVDIVTSGDKYCGPNLNYYYDISSNYWSNWEWISASPGYESVRIDENANGYRLPTTEEWEYFARGGQGLKGAEAAYEHSGAIDDDAIDNVAHHAQYPYGSFNEDSTTFECGKDVNPNSLGLYDLCGNVKEWCFDLVDDDGQRWIIDGVEYDRNAMYTCDRKATIGFRVVRNAN